MSTAYSNGNRSLHVQLYQWIIASRYTFNYVNDLFSKLMFTRAIMQWFIQMQTALHVQLCQWFIQMQTDLYTCNYVNDFYTVHVQLCQWHILIQMQTYWDDTDLYTCNYVNDLFKW